MAAPLGREPYGKAEARTQAAEVYDDSTGTPSPVVVLSRSARRGGGGRCADPTRDPVPEPRVDLLQTLVHVKR